MDRANQSTEVDRSGSLAMTFKPGIQVWLRQVLEYTRTSQAELARRLSEELSPKKYDRAAVQKMTTGARSISGEEMLAIAQIVGAPVPESLSDLPSIPSRAEAGTESPAKVESTPTMMVIRYSAEDGVYRGEPHASATFGEVTLPMDKWHSERGQFAARVVGCAMAGATPIGILDGAIVRCIAPNGDRPAHGRIVLLERERNGLRETVIREVSVEDGKAQLVPRPPERTIFESFALDDPGIRIVGIVTGVFYDL